MNTGPHEDPYRDDLAAYALGALPPPDRSEVEAHVRHCAVCAAELEEMTETAAALALDAPPLEPPPSVRAGLLARIDVENPEAAASSATPSEPSSVLDKAAGGIVSELPFSVPRRFLRWPLRYTATAAAVAGAFAVTATVLVTTNQIDERMNRIERQVAAEGTAMTEMVKTVESQAGASVAESSADVQQGSASELLTSRDELARSYKMLRDQFELDQLQAKESTRTITLRGEGPGDDAIGTLITGHEEDATGVLVVYGLPPADPGYQYQFWLEYQGRYMSVGSFQVGADGYAHIRLPLPEGGIDYLRGGVTMEPIGGSPAPTGVKVLNVSP